MIFLEITIYIWFFFLIYAFRNLKQIFVARNTKIIIVSIFLNWFSTRSLLEILSKWSEKQQLRQEKPAKNSVLNKQKRIV